MYNIQCFVSLVPWTQWSCYLCHQILLSVKKKQIPHKEEDPNPNPNPNPNRK